MPLGNILRGVNEATRAVNNVTNTTRNVSNTSKSVKNSVGGLAKNKKQKKSADPNAWECECKTSNTTKFCGNCGKPQPTTAVCASCNHKQDNPNMKFCGNCGTQL